VNVARLDQTTNACRAPVNVTRRENNVNLVVEKDGEAPLGTASSDDHVDVARHALGKDLYEPYGTGRAQITRLLQDNDADDVDYAANDGRTLLFVK